MIQRYIIGILCIVILCMFLKQCNDKKQWDKERSLYVLNDSLLQKKVLDIKDSNNRSIVAYEVQTISTNQLLTSQSKEIQQLKEDLKLAGGKLKNIQSSTSVTSTTKDSVYIKVDSVVYLKDTGDKDIPFSYIPDSFLTVTGVTHIHIGQDTLRLKGHDLLYGIVNKSSLTFYNETHFLQRQKLKALVTQDNTHTTTGKVQVYYTHPEKKWFEKWYIHVAVGAVGAIILGSYIR